MKKTILVTSVLFVTVLAVAHLYFSNISLGSKNTDNALAVIPNDASLIFEFTNDKGFYEIFSNFQLFDAIIGTKKQTELTYLKETILNNKIFSSITEGQAVFLSFHPEKPDSISFLWTMPLRTKYSIHEFQRLAKKGKKINSRIITLNNYQILEMHFAELNKIFYLFMDNKIAIGTFSKSLIQRSLNSNVTKINKEFIRKINTVTLKNENSPANVFLNYTTAPSFLTFFFRQKSTKNLMPLQGLNGFSSLNMSYRSDALMFNGLTTIDTSTASYLHIFTQQSPIKHTIDQILPENTANFIEYGISNYPKFNVALKHLLTKRKEIEGFNLQLSLIKTQTGVNLERDVKKLWGKEFITFQLSTQEKLGVIKVSNGQKLQFFLEPISTSYTETIRRFNNPNLLYFYFGDPFRPFPIPYFTIIDNQLIVANSPGTIQRFIINYTAKKLLYKTAQFIAFNQLIADQSNVLLLIHLYNSQSNIKSYLKPSISRIFDSDGFGIKNFYGISYQLASNGDHFITNFYAGYKPNMVYDKIILDEADTLKR